MTDLERIVTDEELAEAYGNADFGSMTPREVVKIGILKAASGFYQGSTSRAILIDLKLIRDDYVITPKGKQYLWTAWSAGSTF